MLPLLLLLLLLVAPARAEDDFRQAELRVIQETNRQRAQVGLPPVVEVPGLTRVARQWAREQLEDHVEGHESKRPGRRWPTDRVRAGGVKVSGISENCLAFNGLEPNDLGGFVVDFLMTSPHHKKTMLDARNRGIGVAIARDQDQWRAVQLFSYTLEGEKPGRVSENPGSAPLAHRSTLKLTRAQQQQAEQLAAQLQAGKQTIPASLRGEAANAPIFFALAESSDPRVAAPALDALATLYTANPAGRTVLNGKAISLLPLDADFKRITLHSLKSKQLRVVRAGLRLAEKLAYGKHPDLDTLHALEALYLHPPAPEARSDTVHAFWLMKSPSPVFDRVALLGLAEKQPEVVISTLACLAQVPCTPAKAGRLLSLCLACAGSSNHELRYYACGALGGTSFQGRGEAGRALHRLLSDPVAAVRAAACYEVGRARRLASVTRLVALAADSESATFQTGHGSQGGRGLGTVGDAALRALHQATANLPGGFRYRLEPVSGSPNPTQLKMLEQEARRARLWLKSAPGLPPQEP